MRATRRRWVGAAAAIAVAIVVVGGVQAIRWASEGTQDARRSESVALDDAEVQRPVNLRLDPHADIVEGLAFSGSGTRMASGSHDRTVRVWDVQSAALIGVYGAHSVAVTHVALNHEGTEGISGSGTDILLWTVGEGGEVVTRGGLGEHVLEVGFRSDGTPLAATVTPSGPSPLVVWNARDSVAVGTWSMPGKPGRAAFDATGEYVAAATLDGDLSVFRIGFDEPIATVPGSGRSPHSIAVSQGGALVAWDASVDTVRVWDVREGRSVGGFPTSPGTWDLVFSGDSLLLDAGRGVGVRLWRIDQPSDSARLGVADSRVLSVAMPASNRVWFATGMSDGSVLLWDAVEAFAQLRAGLYQQPAPPGTVPVGLVPRCGEGGADLRFAGTVVDSITGLPVDSASVTIEGCSLVTDPQGRFDFRELELRDSLQVSASRRGYRRYTQWLQPRSDVNLALVVAPRLRCDGSRETPVPRVETLDSGVVLRLTSRMQAALDEAAPGFRPQPLSDFSDQHEQEYDYACYQAPSAVIGDFNGDGMEDLLAHGRSAGEGMGVVLISSPDGYTASLRDGLIPSTQFLSRVEPGTYAGVIADEPPLTITTQGVLQTGEMYVYRIIYYLDGELHIWDYPFA